eukprot:scaffold128798_cov40-Tisochrysis_lutea.AAC.5
MICLLRGCKGWRLEAAQGLPATHRFCVCEQEAAKRRERNEAFQLNPRPKSAHERTKHWRQGPTKTMLAVPSRPLPTEQAGCSLQPLDAPGAWR